MASFKNPRLYSFPGFARRDLERGGWWARIEGSAIDFGRIKLRRKMMAQIIGRAVKLHGSQIKSEPFHSRFGPFTAQPCKRSFVTVQYKDQSVMRLDTSKTGRFNGWFWIAPESGREPWSSEFGFDHQASVRITLEKAQASTNCRIRFIEPEGISIISDIDDTIKYSRASVRREVLANTFVRPFRIIDGTNEAYQQLAREGVEFHYVSSSPWQLIDPMTDLLTKHEFPDGTLHLREYRIRDQFFRTLRTFGKRGKLGALKMLFEEFPKRRFVLIGDSGESDPELYAYLAQFHSKQIIRAFIRDIPDCGLDKTRAEKLERKSGLKIQTYKSAAQLVDQLGPLLQTEASAMAEAVS